MATVSPVSVLYSYLFQLGVAPLNFLTRCRIAKQEEKEEFNGFAQNIFHRIAKTVDIPQFFSLVHRVFQHIGIGVLL
jgi:hypothetical protein